MTNYDSRRASRRSIVWALASFAAMQFGLAVAIDFCLPELRDPLFGTKLRQLQRKLAADDGSRPLLVMLGSSRTIHAFDAGRLEARSVRLGRPLLAYNFGLPGAGSLTELVCLKRLLARGIRPDALLIEVFTPMLSGHTLAFDFGQYPAARLWHDELPLLRRYLKPLGLAAWTDAQWWREWAVPCFWQRFGIQRTLWPKLLPQESCGHLLATFDAGGWNMLGGTSVTPQRRQDGFERARHEYQALLQGYQLGGPSCEALEELLQICRDERIATALVVMPEGKEFRAWYPSGSWSDVRRYLSDLELRFQATVIDVREEVADQDFLDAHHLLQAGAARFSERLADRSLPLWMGSTLQARRPGGLR